MKSRLIKILAILFGASLLYWFPSLNQLAFELKAGLAALVFAAGFFVFEPIALQVTALLIPVIFVSTNLLPVEEAFAPFADPVVFLILGSLFIAEALRKHELTRKLAGKLLVHSGGSPRLILLSIMIVGAVTSMWVFSTAVVAMLIPVCLTIGSRVTEEERQEQFTIVLLMGLVLATTLGGLSTILGASSNAVASGVLNKTYQWTFLDWMKYGAPLSLLSVGLAWFILTVTVYPTDISISTDRLYKEAEESKIFTREQWITLVVLLGAIFTWLFFPVLQPFLHFPRGLTESAVIGLIAASFLFTFKVINWKDARRINWGVYLIIGGGLALGNGLQASGVTAEFAKILSSSVKNTPYPIVAGLLILSSGLASNTVNNTTVVAIFAPLLSATAQTMDYSPLQLILPMAFGATYGFLLPCASSRMVLIYATDLISSKDMLKIGGLVTIPLVVLTFCYFYLLFALGWL